MEREWLDLREIWSCRNMVVRFRKPIGPPPDGDLGQARKHELRVLQDIMVIHIAVNLYIWAALCVVIALRN
jgi:hypothetical protein